MIMELNNMTISKVNDLVQSVLEVYDYDRTDEYQTFEIVSDLMHDEFDDCEFYTKAFDDNGEIVDLYVNGYYQAIFDIVLRTVDEIINKEIK